MDILQNGFDIKFLIVYYSLKLQSLREINLVAENPITFSDCRTTKSDNVMKVFRYMVRNKELKIH